MLNIEKELDDILEILQNQKKIAIKVSSKSGEYRFGQVKAYNQSIELLKDLKKRIDRTEKIESHDKKEEKYIESKQKIITRNTLDTLQIV